MSGNGAVTLARDQIRHEAKEWREVVERLLGPDAELLAVSRWFCDSRVYRSGGKIAKIRRRDPAPGAWHGLEHEAELLTSLGRPVTAGVWGPWEYSVQDEQPGTPFSAHLFDQQDNAFTMRQRMQVLRGVLRSLRDLHRRGIAHGDLRPENVLVDGDDVRLVDFDMAWRGSRAGVAYCDWIGIGGRPGSRYPLWKLFLFTFVPKTQTIYLRLRYALRGARKHTESPGEPSDVTALRHAWRLAEGSAANARGQGLAYYALSYKGTHFTGERAWQLRWDAISRAVDFSGKSLLELGCNMGLLSSYARMSGAKDALGVDHDEQIIEAATAVADALDSGARFEVADLAGPDDWESRYSGYDIVSALSVVHWVADPERVLRFLGRHREVLYEGHDSLEIETARLNSLGFDSVEVVMTTERSRNLLIARRTDDA